MTIDTAGGTAKTTIHLWISGGTAKTATLLWISGGTAKTATPLWLSTQLEEQLRQLHFCDYRHSWRNSWDSYTSVTVKTAGGTAKVATLLWLSRQLEAQLTSVTIETAGSTANFCDYRDNWRHSYRLRLSRQLEAQLTPVTIETAGSTANFCDYLAAQLSQPHSCDPLIDPRLSIFRHHPPRDITASRSGPLPHRRSLQWRSLGESATVCSSKVGCKVCCDWVVNKGVF